MLENYLMKGLVIGIVFGVPAGVVGVLSIQRAITQGSFAGLITGIGSSVADLSYACVGVFGITVISDFLSEHKSFICMAGCLIVIAIGIQTIRKTGEQSASPLVPVAKTTRYQWEQPRHITSYFLSSFAIAITNPATILSFMAVFSMFQIEGTESVVENVQLVFGIFCGTCAWWFAIAVIVSMFRKKITESIYLKLNQIFGALMILFGIVIGVRGFLLG